MPGACRGRTVTSWAAGILLAARLAVCAPPDNPLGDPIFHAVADARAIPENVVAALEQDHAGFLWIGTPDGVVRYDGYVYRTFRHDLSDAASLAENHVKAILGMGDGRVWIGTAAGLSIFDPATEKFLNLGATLSSPLIADLADAGDGRVWVGTPKGLDLVDGKTLAVTHLDPSAEDGTQPDLSKVNALLVDRNGDLWIGSGERLLRRRKTGAIDPVTGLGGKTVQRLFQAKDGALWIGLLGGGLTRYDPATGALLSVPQEEGARAFAFAQPEPDTLWIGTALNGIERIDPKTGEVLSRHRHDASVPESLVSNRIRSLLVDRSGIVWIGTTGRGLASYNPADAAFRVLHHSPARPDGLTDEEVDSVFESKDGLLWVGTHENGADVFEGSRRVAGYRAGEDERSIDSADVRSFAETDDGSLWMGTYGILNRLDRKTGKIERIVTEPFARRSAVRIQHLLPSPDGSTLWVAASVGLASLDLRTRAWSEAVKDDGKRLAADITDIVFAKDGTLWVAGLSGVAALPRGATQFVTLRPDKGTDGTLPVGGALSLLPDSKGRLWVGMSTGLVKLVSFDGKTARFEPAAASLDLANRRCDNLLEDALGRIWIEDDVAFDPETLEKRTFGPDEGAGRSIWRGAIVKTRAGRFVMGGSDGLFFVDPEKVKRWDYAPPVVLTALRVDGRTMPPASHARVVVPPGSRSVAFEFTSLDLAAPHRNRYSYQLQGFDQAATEVDAEHRIATYTALPPGDYVLEVKGSNREGRWSTSVLSVPLHVEPALYQTTAFRLLAALLLVGLTWPLYRFRLRILETRQRELEGLVLARTVELRQSEQRANAASEAKSAFLANMSHELRTPLNAVLGFAQLMRRSQALSRDDHESLAIIRRSGEHLLSLINQVLSISKIEAGKMTLEVHPFDPRDLLRTLERMFQARAEQAGLRLLVEVDDALPAAVAGDAGKLRQVLINLLGNAVKFTRAGLVSLRVTWESGRARFEVSDSGVGIAEEELPLLFQPFAQTESGRASKEGTGLGLAITRRIVELMGGTIQVESRKGEGTRFRFEIALAACDPAPLEARPRRVVRIAPGQTSPRFLVADDVDENRTLLRRLLEAVGLEVKEALNGATALELVRTWRPALVFMDMRMPVMDGSEAIRRIRQDEAKGSPRTVLVAVTASVLEQDASKLKADGADDVVFKPYAEETIFEVIARRLGVRFEYEGVSSPRIPVRPPTLSGKTGERPLPAQAVRRRRRILLADDDAVSRTLARSVLSDSGYDVVEATNGEEALSLLDTSGAFDALLLDVEMPRLSGIETVKRLRADARFRMLPVLALTAHDDPAQGAALLAAGMDGLVSKPFEAEQLLEALSSRLDAP